MMGYNRKGKVLDAAMLLYHPEISIFALCEKAASSYPFQTENLEL